MKREWRCVWLIGLGLGAVVCGLVGRSHGSQVGAAAAARISGEAVLSGDGSVASGVRIILSATSVATTDAAGRFVFASVLPGSYAMRAIREVDGYLLPEDLALAVAEGEVRDDIRIALVQGAGISGRVMDSDGRPSGGARVEVLAPGFEDGVEGVYGVRSVQADINGEYRIFPLVPGPYVIRARSLPGFGRGRRPAIGVFPTAADLRRISGLVRVGIGEDLRGADVVLMPHVQGVSLRGAIAAPSGRSRMASLSVVSEDDSQDVAGVVSVDRPSDSGDVRFEIRDMLPGRYAIYAEMSTASSNVLVGKVDVVVGSSDLDGVSVPLREGASLTGILTMSGGEKSGIERLRLYLRPIGFVPGSLMRTARLNGVAVGGDGRFSLPDLLPGDYRIRISGLPDPWYVADLVQGARSIIQTGVARVDAERNEPLGIVCRDDGARIEGVASFEGRPLGHSVVTLVPRSREKLRNAMQYARIATDEAGRFRIGQIAPGEYSLYAWERIPAGAEHSDDFLTRFGERRVDVVVVAGQSLSVQLAANPAVSQ